MRAIAVALALSLFAAAPAFAEPPLAAALPGGPPPGPVVGPLPALGADSAQTSVSGLSSGGYMASQFHLAYSASLIGAGIIAGGPFYCAQGAQKTAIANCMFNIRGPETKPLVAEAVKQAAGGGIDPLSNLARQRVYLFHGRADFTVWQPVVASTVEFYTAPEIGVLAGAIRFNRDAIAAGHGFVSPDFGVDCDRSAPPFVNHCAFDQPGETLDWLYGHLAARVAEPVGEIRAFDQREFFPDHRPHALGDTGYLYLPPACAAAGAGCRLHVVFHGCRQNAGAVGDAVYAHAGYNNWADANKLILLYPQTATTAANNGCWDWFGYDDKAYYTKRGPQMAAVHAMIKRLTAVGQARP